MWLQKIVLVGISVFASITFLSCGGGDVAGGFGSETSSGVAVLFDTTVMVVNRSSSSQVAYEIFSSQNTPTQGALKALATDTIPLNFTDSVVLSKGSYTLVSHLLGSSLGSITQRIEVDGETFTPVEATLAPTGRVEILIPKDVVTNSFLLYIKGTPFSVDLATKKSVSKAYYQVFLDSLPTGEYDSLVLFDSRNDIVYGKVSSSFMVLEDDTVAIMVDTANWPQLKSDGVVTVNWRLRDATKSAIQGKSDTVVTYLISAEYDSYRKNGFIDSSITYDAEATITFRNIPYGEYNLFTTSKASGFSSTISLVVENNQGVNVSDTLRAPAKLAVSLSEDQKSAGKLLFLQGSNFFMNLDGGSEVVLFDSLPAKFSSVTSLVDIQSIIATSTLFILHEGVTDTVVVQ